MKEINLKSPMVTVTILHIWVKNCRSKKFSVMIGNFIQSCDMVTITIGYGYKHSFIYMHL